MPADTKSPNDVTIGIPAGTIIITGGQVAEEVRSVTGPRKARIEERRGHQFNAAGRLMKKVRIVDRKNDRYVEHVSDPVTGEVLRDVDEPLREHTGRGAAKPGK